jgi:glycosyltransferase involved in cell wall biosynthesis
LRGFLTRRRRARGFARALACADAATPGNAFLAGHCGVLPRAIIPSAVPLDVPRHVPREAATPFRVGWVGRSTNLRYVRAIAPAFAALARRFAIELVCVSDAALVLPGCAVTHLRWSAEREAEHIAAFDVGIMPLDPDEWSRGKSAYKLLQYMAAGLPALGSAVGMNADLIRSDHNGLLARDALDWERQLARLVGDIALRRRLGEAGWQTAQDYGYAAVADRLAAFLAEVAGASSASR